MLVLSSHFKTARRLAQAALLLVLAGCSARAVHERQPPALPGGGTYTWDTSRLEPVPGVPASVPGAAGSDGIRAAIDNGLGKRGYAQRPESEAAWRISYRSGTETREEKLVPDDRLLQPRMVCGLHDCRIVQEFVHFGPPRFAKNPEYTVTLNTVQVQIHDVKSGQLVWQGKVASEPDDVGQPDIDALRKKMNRLLRTLPSARHNTVSASPSATSAPQ